MPRDIGVVIVAAGRGTRFGSPVPKQYKTLAGIPVLLHAIRPFASHPEVARIVVVVPADDAVTPPPWLDGARGERLTLVAGGDERRHSVNAGLAALADDCVIVLVHDGARPFPARTTIDAGIAAARRGRSAVPAIPVADTVKRADDFGRVLSTVDRHGLWAAQTPQAFPRAVLARAHGAPGLDELTATDDATLVERLGEPVDLIPGSIENLKITTAHDLELATWYASRQ
ncbi:MAG TPA: 2-C-methyl-D-erythritol 4-phosphate cytidylyltransferase [Gemmatimonadales bacterium]